MSVAVVCCYRPEAGQDRPAQLAYFVDAIAQLLSSGDTIVVVEQSADGRRFNRGQLLNSGAEIARRCHGARDVVLHDVDLLPTRELAPEYRRSDRHEVVHLAAAYERYAGPSYMGGIVRASWELLRSINGFPNDFWGWGGEDDAMRRRCQAVGLCVRSARGGVIDLERDPETGGALSMERKLRGLRERGAKCPDKRERLAADAERWHRNGLNEVVAAPPRVLREYRMKRGACTVHHCVLELAHGVARGPPSAGDLSPLAGRTD